MNDERSSCERHRTRANLMGMQSIVSLNGEIEDCFMSTGFKESQSNMQEDPTKQRGQRKGIGKFN